MAGAEEWLPLLLHQRCWCEGYRELVEKKGKFDYILLETTGLADPGPIAAMFWLDEGLGSEIYLDGIVTVLDSKHCMKQMDEKKRDDTISEAIRQVALADIILINKTDLVSREQLKDVEERICNINSMARMIETVLLVLTLVSFWIYMHTKPHKSPFLISHLTRIPMLEMVLLNTILILMMLFTL